jgi:stress-induced morphogen
MLAIAREALRDYVWASNDFIESMPTMLDPNQLKNRIIAAWPDAQVDFNDTTGTGDHFQAVVVAPSFEGKTMVEQHKMVYALFDAELKSGALHALALKTYTPTQWDKKKNK